MKTSAKYVRLAVGPRSGTSSQNGLKTLVLAVFYNKMAATHINTFLLP